MSPTDEKLYTELVDLAERGLRYHGNGFMQLYLNKNTRMHIWSPNFAPFDDHTGLIHNHTYDMESTVYSGVLEHTIYGLRVSSSDALATHKKVQVDSSSKTIVDTVLGYYDVEYTDTYLLPETAQYTFAAGLFHTSQPSEYCLIQGIPVITIFEKTSKKRFERPHVLAESHVEDITNAFDPLKSPSKDALLKDFKSHLIKVFNSYRTPDISLKLRLKIILEGNSTHGS